MAAQQQALSRRELLHRSGKGTALWITGVPYFFAMDTSDTNDTISRRRGVGISIISLNSTFLM